MKCIASSSPVAVPLPGHLGKTKVKEETIMGLTLGARATPVFLINDMMLVGAHPFETFREIIEEELQASQKDRAPGKQK